MTGIIIIYLFYKALRKRDRPISTLGLIWAGRSMYAHAQGDTMAYIALVQPPGRNRAQEFIVTCFLR